MLLGASAARAAAAAKATVSAAAAATARCFIGRFILILPALLKQFRPESSFRFVAQRLPKQSSGGRRLDRPTQTDATSRLERVRVRLVLNRYPLPMCEFLPIRRPPDARAVARSTGTTERNVGLIGDSLVVDVQEASA